MCILQDPEHNPIDGFDEVVSLVLDVARFEFLIDLSFMLIFINKLSESKASTIAKQIPNVLDDMRTLDAALEQGDLGHNFVRSMLFSIVYQILHAFQDLPKNDLGVAS